MGYIATARVCSAQGDYPKVTWGTSDQFALAVDSAGGSTIGSAHVAGPLTALRLANGVLTQGAVSPYVRPNGVPAFELPDSTCRRTATHGTVCGRFPVRMRQGAALQRDATYAR